MHQLIKFQPDLSWNEGLSSICNAISRCNTVSAKYGLGKMRGIKKLHVHAANLYTNIKDASKYYFLFPHVAEASRSEHLQTSEADIGRRIIWV